MRSASIIAATFGWDVSEVKDTRYQSTRTSIAIYACSDDHYYCVAKRKPSTRDGFDWHPFRDQFWANKNNTTMWESSDEVDEERTRIASDYKVAEVNGRSVIMLRKFAVVVAEFADNTKSAVDFFTDILGT